MTAHYRDVRPRPCRPVPHRDPLRDARRARRRADGQVRRATLNLDANESIDVPTTDDIGRPTERLTRAGVAVCGDGATVSFDDPWTNVIRVRQAA